MSLPTSGAVVKDVLVSRSPDGDDIILFEDGTQCLVRKPRKVTRGDREFDLEAGLSRGERSAVRMVRDRGDRLNGGVRAVSDEEYERGRE